MSTPIASTPNVTATPWITSAQRHAEADQHRRHCGVPRHVQAAERWWAFRLPVPMWVPQSNTLANRKMPWFRTRPS